HNKRQLHPRHHKHRLLDRLERLAPIADSRQTSQSTNSSRALTCHDPTMRATRSTPPSRGRYSLRPFVVSLLLLTLFTIHAVVFKRWSFADGRLDASRFRSSALSARAHVEDADCRLVHQAADQCAFILANCEDDEAG